MSQRIESEMNTSPSESVSTLLVSSSKLCLSTAPSRRGSSGNQKAKGRHSRKESSEKRLEQSQRFLRQLLSAQEDERKKISRDLHDVVAQMLTGINIRLERLKGEASHNTKNLEQNIAKTQRLVEELASTVHDFARELRPMMLDDIGLIPSLHALMKTFTSRTGVRSHLTAFAGVEHSNSDCQTALFRVVQESLTNVGRHARANRVEVNIRNIKGRIRMEITDDGQSFQVNRVLNSKKKAKRLGLLGMRERVEMIGGTFCIVSSPGQGTTVRAEIPFLS
jgi:signal transduction histidine kinase